jgi:hypothetical protein
MITARQFPNYCLPRGGSIRPPVRGSKGAQEQDRDTVCNRCGSPYEPWPGPRPLCKSLTSTGRAVRRDAPETSQRVGYLLALSRLGQQEVAERRLGGLAPSIRSGGVPRKTATPLAWSAPTFFARFFLNVFFAQ